MYCTILSFKTHPSFIEKKAENVSIIIHKKAFLLLAITGYIAIINMKLFCFNFKHNKVGGYYLW